MAKSPESSDDRDALLKVHAGKGVSNKLANRAYWIDHDDPNWDWYAAIDAADSLGDKEPLLALIGSEAAPPMVRPYLKDVLARRLKTNGRRTKRTPAYDVSQSNTRLLSAVREVRSLVNSDASVAEALFQVAESRRLDHGTLAMAYGGRHGGLRRVVKRFPALKE